MEILAVEREETNNMEAECSNAPPIGDQIDVRTSLPLLDAKQEKKMQTVPSDLMEVFSVRLLEFDHQEALNQMYGSMLIGSLPAYVVFSRKHGESLNIDSKGFVKLQGPDKVILPRDFIEFCPFLYRYQAGVDQFKDNKNKILWNQLAYGPYGFVDTLLSKKVQSQFGKIEVKYAVYDCAVVAHVGVTLTGCQFPSATTVHGLITAHNSKLGDKGTSTLFDRDDGDGISIDLCPCKDMIALPLARCRTAVPVRSSLTVVVNIRQCSNNGVPVQVITKNQEFKFVARLKGKEVKTFGCTACQVNVGVTWSHYADVIM